MANTQNPFIWYDLMAHDLAAAQDFYGKVVGWTFTDSGNPDEPYVIINAGKTGVGGMMAFREGDSKSVPPFWSGYVHVKDVDVAIKAIETRGGKLYRGPVDVPGMVRFAIMLDPHGAIFNVLTPLSDEQRPEIPAGTAGHIGWRELQAGNLDEAWDFYSSLFGWTKGRTHQMGGDDGVYQLFQISGQDAGGMMKKMSRLPQPCWNFYINVDGIDAAATRVSKGGGTIVMGPHQVPGGQWTLNARDPQGGNFALLSNTK